MAADKSKKKDEQKKNDKNTDKNKFPFPPKKK